jgi:hypothetical protein
MRALIAKLKIPASESQLSLALLRSSVNRSATCGPCMADTSANATRTIFRSSLFLSQMEGLWPLAVGRPPSFRKDKFFLRHTLDEWHNLFGWHVLNICLRKVSLKQAHPQFRKSISEATS